MNKISEQLLQGIDIVVDKKLSSLNFDKTIQTEIYSIVNLDLGEYKVKYQGAIFSAFAQDLNFLYKVGDKVYVTVPEGNFSNKKLITNLVSKNSLNYNSLMSLKNSIFEISPDFNKLYDNKLYDGNIYGVIAGKPIGQQNSELYIYKGSDTYDQNEYHGLFQQYANQYELIRLQASFLTQFYSEHEKGNYGIEIEFYAKSLDGVDAVSYRLDFNSFNGDPYKFSVYSPQSIIIKAQKNYLLGIKSIKLFQEDFEYDQLVQDGLVTDSYNTDIPNIFVKDISLQYVDQKDLSDTNYYLMIAAPSGIAFTSNISSLDLVGRLVYQGKDIMNNDNVENQWFIEDLSITAGHAEYDKNAGFGWRKLNNRNNILNISANEVLYKQRYKLVSAYNKEVVLTDEIEISNLLSKYNCRIAQTTEDANIYLEIVDESNANLKGDWYISYPDGSYFAIDSAKKASMLEVSQYLKYSSVTFYCSIYNKEQTKIIANLLHVIYNSESSEDVVISYVGEDQFRYDSNGDVAIEDTEKERTLQVNLAWREGYGTAYTVSWLIKDENGKFIALTGNTYPPKQSMINSIWIDNSNILHYNIKQKYKINFNNNTLMVKIKTITGEEYEFYKEILFLKDGDQGTNGTTYVLAIRPCDSSEQKLDGFQPLNYNGRWLNDLKLKAYVYKDGELINTNGQYGITYKWQSVNLGITKSTKDYMIVVAGQGNLSGNSQNLQFYVKAQVDINDKMNNKQVSIYASYPIDVLVGSMDAAKVDISSIPYYIKYTSSGVTPQFYNNNINFIYNGNKYNSGISSLNKHILDVYSATDGLYYLKPASSFVFENIKENNESNVGILKLKYSDSSYILHTIIMYLDNYGNEAINGWDGTALDIGDGQYVFAPQVGAGEKDSFNRFTGVVMGKDSAQNKIGLYGYQAGTNTFGLQQDGTAFFGAKSGGGQIVIDGKSGTIYGGNGGDSSNPNNANGMTINLANLSPDNKAVAIKIAKGVFQVNYNGAMTATSADIKGKIYATSGQIGCNENKQGGWFITNNKLYSGTGNNTVALSSDATSPFRIWAGASSPGTSYNINKPLNARIANPAKFVVTQDGYVYMREAFISGHLETGSGHIGGWTIAGNRIYSDKGKMGLSSVGTYRIWINADIMANPDENTPTFHESKYFWVNSDGVMCCKNGIFNGTITANSGTIGGWTISDKGFNNGDNIYLYSDGTAQIGGLDISENLTSFTGKIISDSGKIGGWTISGKELSGGDTILNSESGIETNKISFRGGDNSISGNKDQIGIDSAYVSIGQGDGEVSIEGIITNLKVRDQNSHNIKAKFG